MRYVFSLFFFLFLGDLSAQVAITGKILSNETGEPVTGASVYINNSTIGTSSGADGSYHLNNILPGTYEIIISHIGYEPLVHRVEVKNADLRFTFRLESKVEQMRDILVMTKDQRKAKMKIFKEQFLGITLAADKSTLVNEEDVLFEEDENPSAFRAFSEVPLEIINNELGYRILFELKEFFIDQQSGKTYFYGFTRYEDLEKGNQNKWKKMRQKYYIGSTMHLYHSLNSGTAEDAGFSFFRIGTIDTDGKGSMARAMSKTTAASLVYVDTALHKKYLSWEGDIMVQYDRDPYYKYFLSKKIFITGSLPRGIQTTIKMLEAPAYLDANGILENPLSVQYNGFWGYERLANMLPVNYKPGD